MKQPPLLFFFLFALLAMLFGTKLLPSVRLMTFAPFFSILFLRKPFLVCLWIAALCGLIADLFTVDVRFGVTALCSVATAALTYQLKHYFYEHKFFSIPIYTAAISVVFSTIQLFFIRDLVNFNLQLLVSTLLMMPVVDALYGFVWFTCPRMLYSILLIRRN